MEALREYLKGLPSVEEREAFAVRCGTTLGYLRKAISVEQQLSAELVIAIERESDGIVRCERLRPDIDWKSLRNNRAPVRTSSAAVI